VAPTALATAQKKAVAPEQRLIFLDQSGCYWLPALLRSYAPVAKTPIIRPPWRWDQLSARSGITAQGVRYPMVQEGAYSEETGGRLLKLLLRQIRGKRLVLWDGVPLPRSQRLKAYLAALAVARIHLEQFPG
jgi:hypothetical protein